MAQTVPRKMPIPINIENCAFGFRNVMATTIPPSTPPLTLGLDGVQALPSVLSQGPLYVSVPGITVLLSLTVFMLLVAEIMPATSDSVPLIGKQASSSSKDMALESAWDFAAQAGSRNLSRRRLEGCMAPLFCCEEMTCSNYSELTHGLCLCGT